MLTALNFLATPSAAFFNGVVKGMAAPIMLYGSFVTPIAIPKIKAVEPARLHPRARNDWEAVGADLKVALSRYEQQG